MDDHNKGFAGKKKPWNIAIENFSFAWKMRKSKIEKNHGMKNSVAQTVMFLKMQIFSSRGVNKILNGKNLFFRSQNCYQKKYSKFSFDHIFHRILTKFELDTPLNVICQSQKAVNCQMNILGDFSKKREKTLKIHFFLSWPIFIFRLCLRLLGNSKSVGKNR